MFNNITELFLNVFFLFDVTVGKIVGDPKSLFDKLYDVFLLPESDRAALYALTQCEDVREIQTYANFAQVCRIRKYTELVGGEQLPSDIQDMIAVKGAALRKASQLGFDEYSSATEAAVCKYVSDSANMGVVTSLCIIGFLQCEGIFVSRNERAGIKSLDKAAQWNSLEGVLLALHYDKSNRQTNVRRLYTCTDGTLYDNIADVAFKAYGITCECRITENKLLQKAFGAGILKPELYDSQYARFVFSDVLNIKDKERALFSGHKESIAETADLPLKLKLGDIPFEPEAISALPLAHERECDRIKKCVAGSGMRGEAMYRPLCICSDAEYILNIYSDALCKSFRGAHIERIDVADINEYDLEPTKNNVFVRSCDEDKHNIYIFYCIGDINERVLDAVKNFMQSDKRKKTRLQHPYAVIDMSAVLPVCFCDRQNARELQRYCEVITLSTVNVSEKSAVINHILATKAEQYKLPVVTTDASAVKLLTQYSVDRAEYILDRAVRQSSGAAELTVTADMIREFEGGGQNTKSKYGFGDACNESK